VSEAGQLRDALRANAKAVRRLTQARNRLAAQRARTDMRTWAVARRERTRQLIALGGLVAKAGLVELTDDDRAAIYGALIGIANELRGDNRDTALALMRRRGKRAFDSEANSDG